MQDAGYGLPGTPFFQALRGIEKPGEGPCLDLGTDPDMGYWQKNEL
jgi:hypothetical protein